MSDKLIERTFPSIEAAKASRATLGKGEPCGIFRSPTNKFAIEPIRQVDFDADEAKDIAYQWHLFTGFTLIEYSNGEGFWVSTDAPPPRKRLSFTVEMADARIDELETQLAEAKAQLDVAKKIVKSVAPLAVTYMNYQQSGQTRFLNWLVGCGDEQVERDARMKIVQLLLTQQGKALIK